MSERLAAVAIGAHPDDVELGCGATLAKLALAGRQVGILHLTRGEMGTRGTPSERQAEAERAADALGVSCLDFLDCGDGGLVHDRRSEDALIGYLRAHRPDLVLAPAPEDRHPDHGRAHRLVADAAFYAGLAKRAPELGEPFRPGAVFCYMQHNPFPPSFIVDVSATWKRKMAALDAYESQIFQGRDDERPDEPLTKVASREFRLAMEGRGRHFGQLINAAYGEPFWSATPLAVDNPWNLIPEGIR
ncbi:MAG TPA: bacillithiol biosynthesis deacetylase BshB1 [Thermoanaerobaculia bacterium]|nr:bacillithiol biosynthesis deacetylase BshB1 [Thermoanaerobaculia bacterium]